jgi:DNA-binding transcriptional LysR family regulator
VSVDLNLFRVFHAVMIERSVTRAARRLDVGQPAVSAALARLRAVFGDPLFVRARHGIVPTERAEEVAPIVERAVSDLETAATVHQVFDAARSRRTFRVLASEYAEGALLPALVALIAPQASDVRVHVLPLGATLDAEVLRSGKADLAIGRFDAGADDDFVVTPLMEDELVCIVRRDTVPARRLSLARYQAMHHVVVAPPGKLRTGVFRLLDERGVQREVRARVTSFEHAAHIVISAGYCATIPARIAAWLATDARLAVFPVPVKLPAFPTHLAWHPRHRRDAGHAWLRGLLADCTQTRGGRHLGARERARAPANRAAVVRSS